MMLLITEFTTERGEAFTVLQLLKRLRSAIIQIDRILYEHQGRIEELEIDVEEIKNNIEDIKEQLLNIINRVDTLENKVDIVEETLINIESNITNIETILNNHGDDISALNNLVTSMSAELNELQDIVNNIPIVQPSLLNGYIKIDGVDVPVFVGGAGGGGGSKLIHFNEEWRGNLMRQAGENKILIDLPEFDEFIELNFIFDVYMSGSGKSCKFEHYLPYESESNTMILQGVGNSEMKPATDNCYNYYIVKCKIVLIKNPSGNKYTKIFNSTIINKSNDINNPDYIYEIIQANTSDWSGSFKKPKWLRIDMRSSQDNTQIKLSPFAVFVNTDLGSGGNGGSGDTVQTFKTLGVSLHNEDNDTIKNIFTMPTSESYLSKYKYFKGRLTFTSSGASNIKLKINNNDFDLYPVRSDVYCIIDYNIRVETLGLVTELIVSWYNNGTRELITTESKYYYPVETSEHLTMGIIPNISTYGFLNVHNGLLTAYPFTGEISQEV